jgi:hypothetical protein
MPTDSSLTTPWRIALWASAVAVVVPLWCAHHLPFSDWPEQVAAMATLCHYWTPGFRNAEHYQLALANSQYLLFHVVGALLSIPLGSAERACRVLLTAVGFAYPFALRSLLRALGRDERLALAGAAAFWSRPLTMGFLPYVAAVPFVLWGSALVVEQLRAPTRRRTVGLVCVSLALCYLHASAYLLFVIIVVALVATRALGAGDRSVVRAIRSLAFLVPSAVPAVIWFVYGSIANRASSLSAPGQVVFMPKVELLWQFPGWTLDVWSGHADEVSALLFWVGLLGFLLARHARARAGSTRSEGSRLAWVPLACALLSYVALPYRVGAGYMLNLRMAIFIALFAPLLLPSGRRGLRATLPLSLLLASTLVGAANAAVQVHTAERDELGDVDRLIDRMRPGSRMLGLTFHVSSAHMRWAPWTFLGAYHRSRAGGVAELSFSSLAHWPIRYRPEAAPPSKRSLFWTFDSCRYRNQIDGPYYDYMLVRGNVDPFRDAPPGPRFRKVDTERDFTLYEKVSGPDVPPWPAWPVADRGPCESRRSLERMAGVGAAAGG